MTETQEALTHMRKRLASGEKKVEVYTRLSILKKQSDALERFTKSVLDTLSANTLSWCESCTELSNHCAQEWDGTSIPQVLEKVIYHVAVAVNATGLKQNFGEKIPLQTLVLDKTYFQRDVTGFKVAVDEVAKKSGGDEFHENADALYQLLSPAWDLTLNQLKEEEAKHITDEAYDALVDVAQKVEFLETTTPSMLKKRLLEGEDMDKVWADCENLVDSIISVNTVSAPPNLRDSYKRLKLSSTSKSL